MASSVRIPTIRHYLRQPLINPRYTCQRRWAQVHDVRFLATHSEDRILSKYKDKLSQKAKSEGLNDVSELKEAYKDKIEELRKSAIVPGATGPLTPPPSPSPSSSSSTSTYSQSTSKTSPWPSPPPPPTPQPTTKPPPGLKTLKSFLDLTKIPAMPSQEVESLWRLIHSTVPQSIHFSMNASTFRALLETALKHPSFILPLPREISTPEDEQSGSSSTQQGAELHFLQFTHPYPHATTLLFTTVAEFKLKGEYASPHTTITFHSELADTHNLVLGQGIVVENKGISVDDARWLVMCMQKFYVVSEGGSSRAKLLDMFTQGDSAFKVDQLLEEAEKIV